MHYGIMQLAHIARPGEGAHGKFRAVRKAQRAKAHAFQNLARYRHNVVGPFAKRRNFQGEGIDAVVKILPK